MPNPLSEQLWNSSPEQLDRLLCNMDTPPLDKALAGRLKQQLQRRTIPPRRTRRGDGQRVPRRGANRRRKILLAAAATAACLLLLAGVMLAVPGVAQALLSLLWPDYESGAYMMQPPADRTAIPEIQSALEAASPGRETWSVELLGEYAGNLTQYDEEYNTNINTWRVENGFGALDKEEFAFLRDIRPEVREVLYDGRLLTVNTYLHTDHAADFLVSWGADVPAEHRLDATCFAYFFEMGGRDLSGEYQASYSSGTATSLMGKSGEAPETLDGVWHTLMIDPLPKPLPDGEITMTILYYIYDGSIDDMGSVGNIARIIHTFTFDTTAGNATERISASASQSDGGSVPVTVTDWDEGSMYNRSLPLDGLTLRAEADFGSAGIYVRVSAESYPAGWTEAERTSFFCPGEKQDRNGLSFDLYVNDEFVKTLLPRDSSPGEINLELPVFPSDYDSIRQIRLRPAVTHLVGCEVCQLLPREGSEGAQSPDAPGVPITLEIDGEPYRFARGSATAFEKETYSTVALPGLDLVIPLPGR